MATFGKDIMQKEFMLDSRAAFINHGSFGTAPRRILEKRLGLIKRQEQQPDLWFRKDIYTMWAENLTAVSRFVRSRPENLVFVSNTTTGVNAVLRSLSFSEGDGLLLQPYTYFAVRTTCEYVASIKGLKLVTVELPSPLTCTKRLIEAYDQALKANPNIKLVVLDYISSMPAIYMPVKQLIALCRQYGVLVLVDGAHTPGQVDLDLENLGADFYVGNLHKWAFAARGCAILWIHPNYHHVVFPVVTSKYDVHDMQINYAYQGTNDNSQYFVVDAAVQFYRDIGDYPIISHYNIELVTKAADLLVAKWNTRHYPLADELRAPYMRMVRLPNLKRFPLPEKKYMANDMNELMTVLWNRFQIQVVCVEVDSEPWTRISAMVYNCIEDYERFADAVLTLKAEDDECPKGSQIVSKY